MTLASNLRHPSDHVCIAEVTGRLVYGDPLQLLKTELAKLLGEPRAVVILDLSKVEYADSSGLGSLLYLDGLAQKAGATLRVAAVTPRVRELLQMTHTDKILKLDTDISNSLSQSGLSAEA